VTFASRTARSLIYRSTSRDPKVVLLALVGFVSPLRRSPSTRPLPASNDRNRSCLRADAAKRQLLFRPRGLAPPRRFPPRGGCGLVASRSRPWGSSRFPASRLDPSEDGGETGRRPRDAHTLRRIPLTCSRTTSPSPLPSWRLCSIDIACWPADPTIPATKLRSRRAPKSGATPTSSRSDPQRRYAPKSGMNARDGDLLHSTSRHRATSGYERGTRSKPRDEPPEPRAANSDGFRGRIRPEGSAVTACLRT
jgi:hypothetical protein